MSPTDFKPRHRPRRPSLLARSMLVTDADQLSYTLNGTAFERQEMTEETTGEASSPVSTIRTTYQSVQVVKIGVQTTEYRPVAAEAAGLGNIESPEATPRENGTSSPQPSIVQAPTPPLYRRSRLSQPAEMEKPETVEVEEAEEEDIDPGPNPLMNIADPQRRYSLAPGMSHSDYCKLNGHARSGLMRVVQDDTCFESRTFFPKVNAPSLVEAHPFTRSNWIKTAHREAKKEYLRRMSMPTMGRDEPPEWVLESSSEGSA